MVSETLTVHNILPVYGSALAYAWAVRLASVDAFDALCTVIKHVAEAGSARRA